MTDLSEPTKIRTLLERVAADLRDYAALRAQDVHLGRDNDAIAAVLIETYGAGMVKALELAGQPNAGDLSVAITEAVNAMYRSLRENPGLSELPKVIHAASATPSEAAKAIMICRQDILQIEVSDTFWTHNIVSLLEGKFPQRLAWTTEEVVQLRDELASSGNRTQVRTAEVLDQFVIGKAFSSGKSVN